MRDYLGLGGGRRRLSAAFGLASAIALSQATGAIAQTAIDSLTGSYQPGTSSSYTTTVANPCNSSNYPGGCDSSITLDFGVGATNDLTVTGFQASSNDYSLLRLADEIKFQRIDGAGATGERQLMFFERSGSSTTQIRSSYTNDMEVGLLSDIANRGIDNTFSNDNGQASNNIERIDYIVSNGLSIPASSQSGIGFLVLERGGNDPFKVAAITSLDASGNPASFGPLQDVTTATWGESGFSITTAIMRREESEPAFRPSHTVNSQRIEGVFLSLADMSVAPNQTIFGYSLFPNDTPGSSTSNDLVNLTNFPTNTSGGSGQGGLDLVAGGGIYLSDAFHTVSGTLYEDADADDSLTSGEPTLPDGIEVVLYQDSNSDGNYDVGEEIQTTNTTGNNGSYSFLAVADGTYRVFVDDSDTDIPNDFDLGTPNDVLAVVSGADQTGIDFGFDDVSLPSAPTFTCDSSLYIVIGSGRNGGFSQLNSINRSNTPFTFDPIGAQVTGYNYNALAYNPVDNYLYGIVETASASSPFPAGTIVRLGSDGVPISLGLPQGDAINTSPNAGTFLANGTYVVSRQTSPVFTIDVTTTPPTATNRGAVAGARFEDIAVNPYDTTPNRVYGIDDNSDRLVHFDLSNTSGGATPAIPSGSSTPNHNHGSQFYDVFGNLLYRSASTDALYIVESDGSATLLADTPDGGSHDGASCFAVGLSKDINDTQPVPAGQSVTYTYQIANASALPMSVTLTDDLRAVTDYPGSADDESATPVNGTYTGTVTTPSGTVALSNSNQTISISDIALAPQSITSIEVDVTVPVSASPDTYYNQATLTELPPGFVTGVSSDYPTTILHEDPTPLAVSAPLPSDPDVLLVKRITAINRGQPEREQLFDTSYVDVAGDANDNEVNWPGATEPATIGSGTVENYIRGITGIDDVTAISNTTVRSGDQIEYTIPFLSNGDAVAQDLLICDRIPTHTTFDATAFNGSTPAAPGPDDRGIFISFNGQNVALTNANDGDELTDTGGNDNGVGGYYFPPLVDPSTELGVSVNCGGPNDNGAIVVDLSDVPNATGDGVPLDSHGFIRFITVVD